MSSLSDQVIAVHAVLPQTQCQRCGFNDCLAYAQAIVDDATPINRCAPGGAEGIRRLAAITNRDPVDLDSNFGQEQARTVVWIDEDWCIGCTLCLKACPVDAIVGASKQMHTVIENHCTGCELCLPVCPVDCIQPEIVSPDETGWDAWSIQHAGIALKRYRAKQSRSEQASKTKQHQLLNKAREKLGNLGQHSQVTDPSVLDHKKSLVEAAIRRAKERLQNS